MTHHDPSSRIVGLKCQDQPTSGGQHGNVSAGRIVEVECGDKFSGVVSDARSKDVEVVAVQMYRVWNVDCDGNTC